jgi:hypothetical protein
MFTKGQPRISLTSVWFKSNIKTVAKELGLKHQRYNISHHERL